MEGLYGIRQPFRETFLILFLASLVGMGYSQNPDQSSITGIWYCTLIRGELVWKLNSRLKPSDSLIEEAGHLYKSPVSNAY